MTRSQEIVVALVLILWAVQCGCWHYEAKAEKADAIAFLHDSGARVIEVATNLERAGVIG